MALNGSTVCLDRRKEEDSFVFYSLAVEFLIDCVLTAALIFINVIIMISILKNWRSCTSTTLASASSRLVLSLAISDILVGLSSLYYYPFFYFCDTEYIDRKKWHCFFKFGFILFAHSASWNGLVAIAIDRYTAVVHALRYSSLVNNRRVSGIIIMVWITSAACTLATLIFSPWTPDKPCDEDHVFSILVFYILTAFSFGFGLLTMVVSHWRVHQKALSVVGAQKSKSCFRSRSGCILFLTTIGCIVSFVPSILILILRLSAIQVFTSAEAVKLLSGSAFTISRVNFIFNPFIYAWRNTTIRTAMKTVLQTFLSSLTPVQERSMQM